MVHGGYPVRFGAGPATVNRSAAPTLGQHNHQVLTEVCGLSDDEVAELAALGVIGTQVRT